MLHQCMLVAQAAQSTLLKFIYFFGVLGGCIVLPFVIGQLLARRLRMRDHGWRIGLILCSLALAGTVLYRAFDWETGELNLKLGVDLKGGVILIYEVDQSASMAVIDPNAPSGVDAQGGVNMGALVEALGRRINPTGTKEIVIRPFGEQQVEIIIPEVEQREVDQIKKSISTAGVLQFRIVANARDHERIIALAQEMAKDPAKRRGRSVLDESGRQVGFWARVGREQQEGGGGTLKVPVASQTLRDATTGELLQVPPDHLGDDEAAFTRYIADLGIKEIDVLMAWDDPFSVTGSHLGVVSRGYDENLRPCIHFNLKAQGGGVSRFAGLTTEYGPQGGFERQLGIVLDNTLLSAPNIQEPITQGSGRITGQFTEDEVIFLVNILQAGSLPVILNPNPISESQINPLLGRETIQQGKLAIAVSVILVLGFMLVYYRFAGFVACLAVLANLIFIVAIMVLIRAAFTLPGLAGLVLTVGMAVDANVLIYERMREELSRGAGVRTAIRNGFSRALSTIVDSNVTTLISGVVLYAIGTDQIRGFAVTLILGILMSMYTAIFCSRVVFDVAERTGWLTQINMMQLLTTTQINFMGMWRAATAVSLVAIAIGVVAMAVRGSDMLDIDLSGGTSVQLLLNDPTDTETVRNRLSKQSEGSDWRFTVTEMNNRPGSALQNTFKIDSNLPEVEQLEQVIRDAFALPDGTSALATYSLTFGELREVAMATPSAAPTANPVTSPTPDTAGSSATSQSTGPTVTPTEDAGGSESTAPPPKNAEGSLLATDEDLLAFADDARQALLLAQAEEAEASPAATQAGEPAAATTQTQPAANEPASKAEVATEAELAPAQTAEPLGGTAPATEKPAEPLSHSVAFEVDLTFRQPINAPTLIGEIRDAAQTLNLPLSDPELMHPDWDGSSSNAYDSWTLRIAGEKDQIHRLLQHLEATFADTPVWPSSNKIGSQVADRMQQTAISAMLACLVGILIYIWIRFHQVVFGIAAIVALVHDVLITLGALAISAWLANWFGFLLIEDFKISLPVVAALLTIVGYSLNDTIVIFDRIREIRGKSPKLTADMINLSVNQTLSRTLLTALTVLMVVVILYAIGGDGIHAFAFAMVIGVVAGTYSTVFIASPLVLMFIGERKKSREKVAAA